MVDIFERTPARHRNTTFVACHFTNLDYDLAHLGEVFDRNPNLYADISARYAETAPIPRFAAQFYEKYADRLVYGTDMGFDKTCTASPSASSNRRTSTSTRPTSSATTGPCTASGLSDEILQQVYHDNAASLLKARGA